MLKQKKLMVKNQEKEFKEYCNLNNLEINNNQFHVRKKLEDYK